MLLTAVVHEQTFFYIISTELEGTGSKQMHENTDTINIYLLNGTVDDEDHSKWRE